LRHIENSIVLYKKEGNNGLLCAEHNIGAIMADALLKGTAQHTHFASNISLCSIFTGQVSKHGSIDSM